MKKAVQILIASGLILAATSVSLSQEKTDYKVGDTIYVNAFYGGCVKATIKEVRPNDYSKYIVRIEAGKNKGQDTTYTEDRLKECKNLPVQINQTAGGPGDVPNQPAGTLKAGDRVDVYLSDNTEGKNRGTIVGVEGGRYKVHYDGCKDYWDEWVNAPRVRPAASISADAAEIKFFTGRWAMLSLAISDTRGYVWGSTSPGIQINGDHTYVWNQGAGKPAVKGTWVPHAKIQGARTGTEVEDGIIIKDAKGAEWKMYRRRSTSDNNDHITISTMCSRETQTGTRVQ
jgi:hypothetical protein